MIKRTGFSVVLVAALAGCAAPSLERDWKSFDFRVYHLGTAGKPEWLEFAHDPPHGRELFHAFPAEVQESEATLLLYQSNVKWAWTVSLN